MTISAKDRNQVAITAYKRIAGEWQLTANESAALLGVPDETWQRVRESETLSLSEDQLQRISAILGIRKGLHAVFSAPLVEHWIKRANAGELFCGRRPIDVMIEGGFPAILQTRRHLEALG